MDLTLWKAEIVGYTAPKGKSKVKHVVPLDDDACVEAQLVSHWGTGVAQEWADVTKLVEADHVALELVAKVASRMAHEAFAAGVRHQQAKVAEALGFTLAEGAGDGT